MRLVSTRLSWFCLWALLWSEQVVCAAIVEVVQRSVPAGIVSQSTMVDTPTNFLTASAPVKSTGYCFTHWMINGTRINDFTGRAGNPVRLDVYEPIDAVANYMVATSDADTDGIPDWYEIHFYGDLAQTPASDTEGDGLTLFQEYQWDLHPNLSNTFDSGGVSMRNSEFVMMCLDSLLYIEQSDPEGLVSRTLAVSNGTTVISTNLGHEIAGYAFACWTVNGNRQADGLGMSLTRFITTITNNTTATALYLPVAEDTDIDGIPDWWELRNYGVLSNESTSDSDGDGLTLQQEYQLDSCPVISNLFVTGGVSMRNSGLTTVNLAGFYDWSVGSDPVGLIISQSGISQTGTVITTPSLGSEISGYAFGQWTLNNVRQADGLGISLSRLSFTVTTTMTAVAQYFPAAQDTDGDGLPDWWENRYFGNFGQPAHADTDSDGYSLLQEYRMDSCPVISNSFISGGISMRNGEMTAVDMQSYERLEYVLVDHVLTRFFTIWPTGAVATGIDFGANAAPGPGDWDGDGDPDLFVGASGGIVRVFQDIGTRHTLNYSEKSSSFSGIAAAWNGITNPYPSLGDWNGDGKDDLAVGGDGGRVRIISSPGDFNNPQAPAVSYDLTVSGSQIAIPALAEMSGDTNLDLLVLLGDGTVNVYENSGNTSLPFSGDPAVTNCFGTTVTGGSGLSMRDINRDAVGDALAADTEGRIWEFYRNAATNFVLQSKVWGGTGQGFAERLTLGAADLDGDTDTDAICGYAGGGLMYLRDPDLGPPQNLQAWDGPDSVLLTWEPDRQTRLRGYNVYRGTSETGTFSMINASAVLQPEFRDTQAVAGVTNYYYVRGLSATYLPGNTIPKIVEGPRSDIVSALTRHVILWMPDYSGRRGSNAVLQINATHATGISGAGMDIRITYSTNALKPVSQLTTNATVRKTVLTADLSFSDNSETSTGVLEITGSSGLVIGEGHLFDVYFVVNSNAVPGSKTTNIFSQVVLKNAGGVTLGVDSSDIAVMTVQNIYFLGDVNGDGILSMADHDRLMELLKKDSPPPTAEELYAGDINGNGELDHKDIPLLLKLIHGQPINPN